MTLRKLLSGGTILALVFLAGCAREEEQPAAPAEKPAAAGKKVDPATAATVSGKVNFQDGEPRRNRIRMAADAVCQQQHDQPVYSEQVVVNDNGTLRHVFVYVKSDFSGYSFPAPSEAAVLDQQGCVYQPHVIGVRTNQDIRILNSDPTTHNIHPVPEVNREWNTSMPPGADPLVRAFPRPEIMIPVKCNVHPWMKSYIGVVGHPFFGVTGEDGTFEISGLPPGDYTLVAWQEKYGTQEQAISVGPSESKSVEFAFSPGGGAD